MQCTTQNTLTARRLHFGRRFSACRAWQRTVRSFGTNRGPAEPPPRHVAYVVEVQQSTGDGDASNEAGAYP